MGANRSGVRRTARMKRAKKLNERLAKRDSAAAPPEPKGVVAKVKSAAQAAATVVGAAGEGFKEGLSGKKETKEKKEPKKKGPKEK